MLYDLLSDRPAMSDNLSILDDSNNTVVRSKVSDGSGRSATGTPQCSVTRPLSASV